MSEQAIAISWSACVIARSFFIMGWFLHDYRVHPNEAVVKVLELGEARWERVLEPARCYAVGIWGITRCEAG